MVEFMKGDGSRIKSKDMELSFFQMETDMKVTMWIAGLKETDFINGLMESYMMVSGFKEKKMDQVRYIYLI
jgi:hypothetical protein